MEPHLTPNGDRPFAVITGASSGIGFELAKVFARNGFDLLVAAEDSGIAEAAAQCRMEGARIEPLQVDLATYDGVEVLYRRISSLGREVDTLVLNAGVGSGGAFVETDLGKDLNLLQLNVVGVVHLAKLVLRDMATRGRGRVLITSSIAAEAPGPFNAVYSASKAFDQSFAEGIRHEVKDKGITVTALQPGATDTNFFSRANMENTKVGQGEKDDPATVAQDGFDALMAGRDHVIAGSFKNKIQGNLSKVLPERVAAAQHSKSNEPDNLPKH